MGKCNICNRYTCQCSIPGRRVIKPRGFIYPKLETDGNGIEGYRNYADKRIYVTLETNSKMRERDLIDLEPSENSPVAINGFIQYYRGLLVQIIERS